MVMTHDHVNTDETGGSQPRQRRLPKLMPTAATILVAAAVSGVAIVRSTESPSPEPAPRPAVTSDDDFVRDLIARGVVPSATLDDGSVVLGAVLSARSRDEFVRNLVERRLVPAATLDDGSSVVGPVLAGRSRDDFVRDLVARGLVPAATLDDGTEIGMPSGR